ncbi:MAG: cobalamin biosynthesis protein CobD [Selenomonadaceae bacterium]|nr:cobalamin biosynthesis protein CobD [Selenomonadaceae bacterium]MBQ6132468.1 cobalamin biosynthesis protein CobD [Selenomonadaceae bacterium]
MITAVVAFLIDALLGDPRSKFHPVVLIGNLISTLEKILRRDFDSPNQKIFKGGLLVGVVVSASFFVGLSIEIFTENIPSLAAQIFIQALVLSFMISPRTLSDAAREIYFLLERENLPRAREKVGWIVGRNTKNLNEAEIARATVETVAENTVDGIISPLFFFAVGGLQLAVAYRAINTMDSMLGYKNEKYFYFGRAAARLDDVANFIPARLTAILFICAAAILRLDYKNAFDMMRRDAAKHPSPNGGWAEATVAGALNIRLGGVNYYFGEPHFRAYMGDPNEILEAVHILGAIRMMYTATVLFLSFACLIV